MAASAVTEAGNPVWGREKADSERCIECHGVDGHGAGHPTGSEAKFPKLAGQQVAYMQKQIRDFRTGVRKHDQMQIMARSVSDEDVRDIAAYFASQRPMKGEGGTAHARGLSLYTHADPARHRPVPCVACHGVGGKGSLAQPEVPVIGGQEWRYLDQQLRNWRSGERHNSPQHIMNQVTRDLSDTEIEALAHYLSGVE